MCLLIGLSHQYRQAYLMLTCGNHTEIVIYVKTNLSKNILRHYFYHPVFQDLLYKINKIGTVDASLSRFLENKTKNKTLAYLAFIYEVLFLSENLFTSSQVKINL